MTKKEALELETYCGELQSFISSVRVAIRKNKELFERLMWSYTNVRELEE